MVIGTKPETADVTMRECADLGIRHVWMHVVRRGSQGRQPKRSEPWRGEGAAGTRQWWALPLRQLSERTILCGGEAKSSFEHPGKMRLVGEPDISCHLAQRSEPGELLTCSIKPPHEQVVVWAGPTYQPKLAR